MIVKKTTPTQALLAGRPYTPAAATNVAETWLRFGWVPPCRQAQDAMRAQLNPLVRVAP